MLYLLGDMVRNFNPFAKSPLSSPKRTNVLQTLVMKMIPPLIFQYSTMENRIIAKWFILGCLIVDEVYSFHIPQSYKSEMLNFYRYLNSFQFWIVVSSFINYVFDTNALQKSDNYGSYYIIFGLPFYYLVRRSLENNRVTKIITGRISMASTANEIRDYLDVFTIKF